eukprot:9486718-Pyramimonas_sp.AAC.2
MMITMLTIGNGILRASTKLSFVPQHSHAAQTVYETTRREAFLAIAFVQASRTGMMPYHWRTPNSPNMMKYFLKGLDAMLVGDLRHRLSTKTAHITRKPMPRCKLRPRRCRL